MGGARWSGRAHESILQSARPPQLTCVTSHVRGRRAKMAPKRKSNASSSGAGSSAGATLYDLGDPYGKVEGVTDDPWGAVGKQVNVPGTFWPDAPPAEQKKAWRCGVVAFQAAFPWPKGVAGEQPALRRWPAAKEERG